MQKTYGDNTRSSSNSLFALGLRVVASPHASASSSVLFQVGVEFWNIIGTYTSHCMSTVGYPHWQFWRDYGLASSHSYWYLRQTQKEKHSMEKLGCKHLKSSTTKWLLESSFRSPTRHNGHPASEAALPALGEKTQHHCIVWEIPPEKVGFLQGIGQRENLQGTRVFIPNSNSWIQEKFEWTCDWNANQTTSLEIPSRKIPLKHHLAKGHLRIMETFNMTWSMGQNPSAVQSPRTL